jgi:hypothetical protein
MAHPRIGFHGTHMEEFTVKHTQNTWNKKQSDSMIRFLERRINKRTIAREQ